MIYLYHISSVMIYIDTKRALFVRMIAYFVASLLPWLWLLGKDVGSVVVVVGTISICDNCVMYKTLLLYKKIVLMSCEFYEKRLLSLKIL